MINVNDLKIGMSIEIDNNIYTVLDLGHVKPGKGAAFVTAKLKNLRTGSIVEERFNSGIKVGAARIEKRDMQYLYTSGDTYVFMNMETYEQLELTEDQVGENKNYLIENLVVNVIQYEGELLGINLPDKIEFTVTETEPAVKGNTTNNALKDAIVETGMKVRVPLFVEQGEKIIVSTADGKYCSRA